MHWFIIHFPIYMATLRGKNRFQTHPLARTCHRAAEALTELQGRLNFFMELLICVTEALRDLQLLWWMPM
jgi:hypothetical protein